jgi:hypothetical protein
MVGDRDAMGIAGQVVENLFPAPEWRLGIDNPVLSAEPLEEVALEDLQVVLLLAMTSSVTADVALAITHFVSAKVVEGLITMLRKGTVVAVLWVEAVVHMAVEAMRAMEPGASSDKDTTAEPLRPIVAVWGAVVWGVVEVAVRTDRRYPDIDIDRSRYRAGGR